MAEKCTNYEFSKKHLDSCQYSIATCKENSKKYSIGDKKRQYRLGKLKYDGGYYKGNEEAADFIFYTCSNLKDNPLKVAVVVELKGRHVEKAFPQIVATLNREKDSILLGYVILARVVSEGPTRTVEDSSKRRKLITELLKINSRRGYPKIPSNVLLEISSKEKKDEIRLLYSGIAS